MKNKILTMAIMLMLMQGIVFAEPNISISMPEIAADGDKIDVKISVQAQGKYDIAFYASPELQINANPSDMLEGEWKGIVYKIYHWSGKDAILDFLAKKGEWKFITVVTYPDGFQIKENKLTVSEMMRNSGITGYAVYSPSQSAQKNGNIKNETISNETIENYYNEAEIDIRERLNNIELPDPIIQKKERKGIVQIISEAICVFIPIC